MALDAMTDEELVIRAEEIIVNALEGLGRHDVTGRTQLSNAIDVAKTSKSAPVFRNWLRYQKQREEFWRVSVKGATDLAGEVQQTLEQIERKSGNSESQKKADGAKHEHVMNQAIRFLGFMRRALVAKDHFDQIPPPKKG